MKVDRYSGGALALAIGYFLLLWFTAPDMGYARDEGYYFKAAEEYARWWGVLFSSRFLDAFSDAEILKHFSYNTEHPPLVKLSQGISYHFLHRGLGVAGPAQGFRAAGFLWASLSVFATYLLGRRLVGAEAGLFAGAALALLPRYFFDAHLACFDVAITAMWTLSLWTFHRAWTAPAGSVWRRSAVAGVVFGLALATKLNALFLPVVFVLLWLVAPPDPVWPRPARGPGGGPDWVLSPLPIPLVSCAILGPLVFFITWPYLWHDTGDRVAAYIRFHLNHEHYPISYFHDLLVAPPFPIHFPFVMTAVTMPAPLLILSTVGVVAAGTALFRKRSLTGGLLFFASVIPLGLIALPTSPIFGGVKHWYNAMPTLLIGAGAVLFVGCRGLSGWCASQRKISFGSGRLELTAAMLVLSTGLAGIIASHPNGIGYYNALVGGYRGGAELGMQRGFWGGLAYSAFDALRELPPGSRIFFNRTNYDSFRMYQREGELPPRTMYGNDALGVSAAIVFEQPEHGETEADIWSSLGLRPVAGTYQDGVTLTQIYRKGRSNRPPDPQ